MNMVKIMLRKILNLTVAFIFAVSNTLYAVETKQSTLRSLSTANMLSKPWSPTSVEAKVSFENGDRLKLQQMLDSKHNEALTKITEAAKDTSDKKLIIGRINAARKKIQSVVNTYYDMGVDAMDKKDYLWALKCFNRVMDLRPLTWKDYEETTRGMYTTLPVEYYPRPILREPHPKIKDVEIIWRDAYDKFLSCTPFVEAAVLNITEDLCLDDERLLKGESKDGRAFDELMKLTLRLREILFEEKDENGREIPPFVKYKAVIFLERLFNTYFRNGKALEQINEKGLLVPPEVREKFIEGKDIKNYKEAEFISFCLFAQDHSLNAAKWLKTIYKAIADFYYEETVRKGLELERRRLGLPADVYGDKQSADISLDEALEHYTPKFIEKINNTSDGALRGIVCEIPVRIEFDPGGIGDNSFLSLVYPHLYTVFNATGLLSTEEGQEPIRNIRFGMHLKPLNDMGYTEEGRQAYIRLRSLDMGFEDKITNVEDLLRKTDASLILETVTAMGIFPKNLLRKAQDEGKSEYVVARLLEKLTDGNKFGIDLDIHVRDIAPRSGLGISNLIAMVVSMAFFVMTGQVEPSVDTDGWRYVIDQSTIDKAVIISQTTQWIMHSKAGTQDNAGAYSGGYHLFTAGEPLEGFPGSIIPRARQVYIPKAHQKALEKSTFPVRIGLSENAETALSEVLSNHSLYRATQVARIWRQLVIEQVICAISGDVEQMGRLARAAVPLREKLCPASINDMVITGCEETLKEFGKLGFSYNILGARSGGSIQLYFPADMDAATRKQIEDRFIENIRDSIRSYGEVTQREDDPTAYEWKSSKRGFRFKFLSQEQAQKRDRELDILFSRLKTEQGKRLKELAYFDEDRLRRTRKEFGYTEREETEKEKSTDIMTVSPEMSKELGKIDEKTFEEKNRIARKAFKERFGHFFWSQNPLERRRRRNKILKTAKLISGGPYTLKQQSLLLMAIQKGAVALTDDLRRKDLDTIIKELEGSGGEISISLPLRVRFMRFLSFIPRIWNKGGYFLRSKDGDQLKDRGFYIKWHLEKIWLNLKISILKLRRRKPELEKRLQKVQRLREALLLCPEPEFLGEDHILFKESRTYRRYGLLLKQLDTYMGSGSISFMPLMGGRGTRAGNKVQTAFPFHMLNKPWSYLEIQLKRLRNFYNSFKDKREAPSHVLVSAMSQHAIKAGLKRLKNCGLKFVSTAKQVLDGVRHPTPEELDMEYSLQPSFTEQAAEEKRRNLLREKRRYGQALKAQPQSKRPVFKTDGIDLMNEYSGSGTAGALEGVVLFNNELYTVEGLREMGYELDEERLNIVSEDEKKNGMPLHKAALIIKSPDGKNQGMVMLDIFNGSNKKGGLNKLYLAQALDWILDGAAMVVEYTPAGGGLEAGGVLLSEIGKDSAGRRMRLCGPFEGSEMRLFESAILEDDHPLLATGGVYFNLSMLYLLFGFKSAEEYLRSDSKQRLDRLNETKQQLWDDIVVLKRRTEVTPGVERDIHVWQREFTLVAMARLIQKMQHQGVDFGQEKDTKLVRFLEVNENAGFSDDKTDVDIPDSVERTTVAATMGSGYETPIDTSKEGISERWTELYHRCEAAIQAGWVGQALTELKNLEATCKNRRQRQEYQTLRAEMESMSKSHYLPAEALYSEWINSIRHEFPGIHEFAGMPGVLNKETFFIIVNVLEDIFLTVFDEETADFEEGRLYDFEEDRRVDRLKRAVSLIDVLSILLDANRRYSLNVNDGIEFMIKELKVLYERHLVASLHNEGIKFSIRLSPHNIFGFEDKDNTLTAPGGILTEQQAGQKAMFAIRGETSKVLTGSTAKQVWETYFVPIINVLDEMELPDIIKRVALRRLKVYANDGATVVSADTTGKFPKINLIHNRYWDIKTKQWQRIGTLYSEKPDLTEDKRDRARMWNICVKAYLAELIQQRYIQDLFGLEDDRKIRRDWADSVSRDIQENLELRANDLPDLDDAYKNVHWTITKTLKLMLKNYSGGKKDVYLRLMESAPAAFDMICYKESHWVFGSISCDILERNAQLDDSLDQMRSCIMTKGFMDKIMERITANLDNGYFIRNDGRKVFINIRRGGGYINWSAEACKNNFLRGWLYSPSLRHNIAVVIGDSKTDQGELPPKFFEEIDFNSDYECLGFLRTIKIPASLKERIEISRSEEKPERVEVVFTGVMTEEDKEQLLKLFRDEGYRKAIETIYDESRYLLNEIYVVRALLADERELERQEKELFDEYRVLRFHLLGEFEAGNPKRLSRMGPAIYYHFLDTILTLAEEGVTQEAGKALLPTEVDLDYLLALIIEKHNNMGIGLYRPFLPSNINRGFFKLFMPAMEANSNFSLPGLSGSGLSDIKSSSAGEDINYEERIRLFTETIADYQSPQMFRHSNEVNAFLEWVETKATLADIKGLISRISQRDFRLIPQTEQEKQRSSVEVDFKKNSDQEEVALLNRIIYAAMHNTKHPAQTAKDYILTKAKEKRASTLFKIAVELAKSKTAINNIKKPLRVAFVFAIWTGRDRMSRQSEDINGEDALRRKIIQLEDLFGDNPLIDWQLIAVDDGSPNNSGKFAESILRNEYPDYYVSGRTKVLYLDEAIKGNIDNPLMRSLKSTADSRKGGSIEYGMYAAIREGADVAIYTDTDISSHLGLAGNLLEPIENKKADVVIGSRAMDDSLVLNRPFRRKIKSWQDTEAYSKLVTRPLLPPISDIRDTQNSFKAFRREVLERILPFTVDKKLSFDTELLLLARGAGYRLKEIGMPWVDTPDRTTVKMSDGLEMAKRILAQRKRFKSGMYELEESRRYERLTLRRGGAEKTFLIIGPLYKSKSLLLAVDEETNERFVIKKLISEEMEDHSSEIELQMKKIPDSYPYIYKPVFMSAGKNQWAGFEDAWAVVYPYIPGESFIDRFSRLVMGTVSYYGIELLDMVVKITDIAMDLEKMGVSFIWDIKGDNIVIKPDNTPVLIDYTIKRTDNIGKLGYLIYEALRKPEHHDVEDIINNTRFANAEDLNWLIKDGFLELNRKVEARGFGSINEFKKELLKFRRFFAKCILRDLIRDWENYDKYKSTIQKLTLDILGIKDLAEFKPKRPVRVIIGAAGLGTRMKSDKPKVLQEVCGEPIIYHVLKETAFLDKRPIVIVRPDKWKDALGYEGTGGSYEAVSKALAEGGFEAEYAFQDYLKGDGNAVLSARELLADFDGDILVVWGDMAVLNPETVLWLTMMHQALEDVPFSIATAAKEKPYAPILEDEHKKVAGSKKGANLTFGRDDVGVFIGKAQDVFRALEQFPKDDAGNFINPYDDSANKKGEINFVQISAILANEGKEVIAPPLADIREFQGVNDFEELKRAELYRQQMQREREKRAVDAKSSSAGGNENVDPLKFSTPISIRGLRADAGNGYHYKPVDVNIQEDGRIGLLIHGDLELEASCFDRYKAIKADIAKQLRRKGYLIEERPISDRKGNVNYYVILAPIDKVFLRPRGIARADKSIFMRDVRAKASKLPKEVCYNLGRSFATLLRESTDKKEIWMPVGGDVRISTPRIYYYFIRGLIDSGINVFSLGTVSSPTVYFAADLLNTLGYAVVTASHNPPEYNGIKFGIAGINLNFEQAARLKEIFFDGKYRRSRKKGKIVSAPHVLDTYVDFLKAYSLAAQDEWKQNIVFSNNIEKGIKNILDLHHGERPLMNRRVAADSGNGTAGYLPRRIWVPLGAKVGLLYPEFDGNFPHHMPNPENPEHLADLIEFVREGNYEVGFSFDTDVDRIGAVEPKIITGEDIFCIIAKDLLENNPGAKVVVEAKASYTLMDYIQRYGGKVVMSSVGPSSVKGTITKERAIIGGETSGHIYHRDNGFRDDGLFTATILLKIMAKTGKTLRELLSDVHYYPASPEIRIFLRENPNKRIIPELKKIYQGKERYGINETDGVRVELKDEQGRWLGWFLVRPSATEPKLTIRFEGRNEYYFNRMAKELFSFLSGYEGVEFRKYSDTVKAILSGTPAAKVIPAPANNTGGTRSSSADKSKFGWNMTKAISLTLGEKITTGTLDIHTEHIKELKILEELAVKAADMLIGYRKAHKGKIKTFSKGPKEELATAYDKIVQDFYISELHKIFPQWRFIAEEGVDPKLSDDGKAEYVCMIDPIDGTDEFARISDYSKKKFKPMFKHIEYGTGIALFKRLDDGRLKPLISIGILPEIDIDGVGFSIAEAVDDIEGAFLNGKRVERGRLPSSRLRQKDTIVETTWQDQIPVAERIAREFRKAFVDVSSLCHFLFLASGEKYSDIAGSMLAKPCVWDSAIGGFIAQKAGAKVVYLKDGSDFFPIDPKRIDKEFRTDSIFAADADTASYILGRLKDTGDSTSGIKPASPAEGDILPEPIDKRAKIETLIAQAA